MAESEEKNKQNDVEQPTEEPIEEVVKVNVEESAEEPIQKLKRLANLFKKQEIQVEGPAAEQQISEPQVQEPQKSDEIAKAVLSPLSESTSTEEGFSFEEFVDETQLISRDAFGTKEMKIKVLEISDEHQPSNVRWKFGDRVKINKILITIKHLQSQEVEEGEFDIAEIEKELTDRSHWTSSNRWIPTSDIKNGYVLGSRHMSLISDAVALEYIVF